MRGPFAPLSHVLSPIRFCTLTREPVICTVRPAQRQIRDEEVMKLSIEISQEEVAEIALMAIGIVDKLNPPAPDYVGSAAAAGTPRAPTPHPHAPFGWMQDRTRSEEHTSEIQSLRHLVCRPL